MREMSRAAAIQKIRVGAWLISVFWRKSFRSPSGSDLFDTTKDPFQNEQPSNQQSLIWSEERDSTESSLK